MNDHQDLLNKMRNMTKELMANGPQSATAVIQKALQDAGLTPASAARAKVPPVSPAQSTPVMRDLNAPPVAKHAATGLLSRLGAGVGAGVAKAHLTGAAVTIPDGAQFIAGSYANAAGTRQYKLYIPTCYDGQPLPLVVMLHGCTQDPDDFARGTQMNAAAEQNRCLVLYPQQSNSANSSKCWNWFNANDQQRNSGEPSILAGMTREVAARYKINPQQIYIAGLSAGGAMAAIMGTVYPDLYAGVGVHSGLPYGAATDLPSALAAMRSGMAGVPSTATSSAGLPGFNGIPIIVFHGDADHTVNVRNGDQVMTSSARASADKSRQVRSQGRVAGGHAYTRTVQHDGSGDAVAEHWLVHGFGHAWAGGSPNGSFTDARGPDATGEMMRFFYTHKNPA